MTCKLCNHEHVGRCGESAPNAQFTCACPGECQHGKHPAYCKACNPPTCNGSGKLDCYCQGDHCGCGCPPECPGCVECAPEPDPEVRCAQLEAELTEARADGAKLQGFNQMLAEQVRRLETGEWSDRDKLWEMCQEYDKRIVKYGVGHLAMAAAKADLSRRDLTTSEKLCHLRWMLAAIPNLPTDGKINRWLGFVQGAMFELRLYTIDEMRGQVTEAKG